MGSLISTILSACRAILRAVNMEKSEIESETASKKIVEIAKDNSTLG